jgi:hypothetical protein
MTELIKDIYEDYIKNPNCVILYTNAATADWNISEALAIARDHDPNQLRTINVVTKIDRREGKGFVKKF